MNLREEVKRSLRILDDDYNKIIDDIILRGKVKLIDLTGVELDFEMPGLARNLLINYCRYDFNNAVEYFEHNFQFELNRLIFQKGVKSYEEN